MEDWLNFESSLQPTYWFPRRGGRLMARDVWVPPLPKLLATTKLCKTVVTSRKPTKKLTHWIETLAATHMGGDGLWNTGRMQKQKSTH